MISTDSDVILSQALGELETPPLSPEFYIHLREGLVVEDQELRSGVRTSRNRRLRKTRLLRTPRPRRRRVFGALSAASVAVAIAALLGGLSDRRPNGVSIVDRAYGAVTPSRGMLHYVAAYWDPDSSSYVYEEHWAAGDHQRIVQTVRGRLFGQIIEGPEGGQMVRYGAGGEPVGPPAVGVGKTKVGPHTNPSEQGLDPLDGYRQVLQSGTLLSRDEISFDGTHAYRIVMKDAAVGSPFTVTYIVRRDSYMPLEYKTHTVVNGVSVNTFDRFVSFEVLTKTPQNLASLDWQNQPTASPTTPMPPPAK